MKKLIIGFILISISNSALSSVPLFLDKYEKLIDGLSYEMDLEMIPELNEITESEFKTQAFPFKNSPSYLDGYSAEQLFSMTGKNVPFNDTQLVEMSGFCSAVFGAQSKRKTRSAMPEQALSCVAIRNNSALRKKTVIAKRSISPIRYRYDFVNNTFIRTN